MTEEDVMYSCADLRALTKVTPCYLNKQGSSVLTWFLLHYQDATRAAVGEIRLDSLVDALEVQEPDTLWLGFRRMTPNAVSVSLLRPADDSVYLNIALHGELEWWYSHRRCWVCDNGQTSPPTKIYS